MAGRGAILLGDPRSRPQDEKRPVTMQHDPGRVVILGGGPTACGVAFRLEELGYDRYRILEASDGPGGLARSAVDERGFTWDLGGHVQFSHYGYYDRVIDGALEGGWLWHDRESWVRIAGRFVPYPLQYNIHRLDPGEAERILEGLRLADAKCDGSSPRNFAEWIHASYGEPLAERFFFPYNLKVWGYPLESLGFSWVGERVAGPDLRRVERNLRSGADDTDWGPNRTFKYPRSGGTGAIWRGVASGLSPGRLRTGAKVVSVDAGARRVRLESGEGFSYDTLVSTLPLDILCEIASPLAPEVRSAARTLVHSSVHIVGVGLRGGRPEHSRTKCWMYFPEPDSPYYRVTVFSNYAPDLVPEGEGIWSLMAEVCESRHHPVEAATLASRVLAALHRDGLIDDAAELLSLWHRRLEHGYPTPTVGRDAALAVLLPALETHRIYSRGRFGAWKYEVSNQDHSFMQGVELVDRLVLGVPEITVADPRRANSGELLADWRRTTDVEQGETREGPET